LRYPPAVIDFLTGLIREFAARRRRLRESLSEWGQSLFDFAVFSGLFIGSAGLFMQPWMAAAAPWGFAAPVLVVVGLVLLELRRRRSLARGADPAKITPGHDWAALLWSAGCAILGAAAFILAWGAKPIPPEPPAWNPPENAVAVEISP